MEGNFLNYYSMYDIKSLGFPDGKSKFHNTKLFKKKTGYWNDFSNIHDFLLLLKEKLNLNTPEDWNLLTQKQIQKFGGYRLLSCFSLYDIKCLGCPDGKLLFNKSKKSIGYWKNKENVLNFLKKLQNELNLISSDDWNQLTYDHIISFGGSSLLNIYSMLELKYLGNPEGISIFSNSKKYPGYWNDEINIQSFLKNLENKFEIKTKEDWKRISTDQIIKSGGAGLVSKYSKSEINNFFLGDDSNSKNKFEKGNQRSSQRWLFLQIQKIFPDEEIVEDYFHSDVSRESGFPVQFDIFLIHKNIAIEYHGKTTL